jgi:hypothetical protein
MAVVARTLPDGTFMCAEVYELGADSQVSLEQDGTFSGGEFDEQAYIDKMRIMTDGKVIIKELIEGFGE